MSHQPDHPSDAPTPVPREFNHPLLYTFGLLGAVVVLAWLFFHFKAVGHEHARGEAAFTVPTKGGGEPDHAKLIADRSQAVLDRGATLYGKQCAACHGPQGEPAQSIYRNLRKDAFKNPNGAGPYATWVVLTKGFGNGMPGFQNLSAEDRYAVVHYVRESFMKGVNPAYVENDSAEVKKLIPAPGSGAAVKKTGPEFEVAPKSVHPPELLLPLLAAEAGQAKADGAALRRWIDAAATDADRELAPAFARLKVLAERQPARVAQAIRAVQSNDETAFATLLVAENGSGSADPVFSLMRREQIQALYARLAAQGAR